MDDLNFPRFVIFLVRFLSSISALFKHNSDFYFIPIEVIYNKLNSNRETIDKLISFVCNSERDDKNFGLEIINYEKISSLKFKEFLIEIIKFSSSFGVSPNLKSDQKTYYSNSKTELRNGLSSIKCAADLYDEQCSTNKVEKTEISDTKEVPYEVKRNIILQKIYRDYFRFLDSLYYKSNHESIFKSWNFIHIKSVPNFIIKSSEFNDINTLFKLFNWKNFENFIGVVLNYFGFSFLNNFRFSLSKSAKLTHPIISKTTKKPQNRFEIDVVAIKSNHILFIDAKYWKMGSGTYKSLEDAALTQASRVWALINDPEGLNKLISSFSANIRKRLLESAKRDNSKIHLYPFIVYSAGHGENSKIMNNRTIKTRFKNNPLVYLIDVRRFHEFIKNGEYQAHKNKVGKNDDDNKENEQIYNHFVCSLKNIQTFLM